MHALVNNEDIQLSIHSPLIPYYLIMKIIQIYLVKLRRPDLPVYLTVGTRFLQEIFNHYRVSKLNGGNAREDYNLQHVI